MTPSGAYPWHQRIGVRLAFGLAALLLVAYFLFPFVHDASLRAFGLPGIGDRIEGEGMVIAPTAAARLELIAFASELLENAEHEAPGRWIPAAEDLEPAPRATKVHAFAWLDADRRVVYASPGLGLARDDLLDPLASGGPGGPTPSGVAAGRIATEIWKEGEFAGWIVVFPRLRPPASIARTGDEWPPAAADEELGAEASATRRWSNRVLNAASVVFVGALALVLSVAVSRMVTRRVTRLSRMAAQPLDPKSMPGPFDETGNDEIATLARSMNAMRARVIELVGDLETRDRERRRWIAQVSHDLRTPLTALIACLTRASEEFERADDRADITERLAVARLDAERLNVMTEDLLDIARLESDESQILEPVPPGELARQATRSLTALAEQSGIALAADVAPGLPMLTADGRRLMRGLENLLRNALHHAQSRVVVRVVEHDGAVRFEVRDDGPGLPQDDGRIDFEALAARRSRADSAGLGLVVVRKVAEAHGGRLGAENLNGGGACVWFEVPAE